MPNLSLAELEAQQNAPPKVEIKEGDGTPTAADLEAERVAQLEKEGKGPDGKPKPLVDQKPGAAAKTEEEIAAEAKALADKAKEEEEDEQPAGSIWEDVDKLRGEKIDVDWGNIPEDERDTPQGILVREKAIEAHTVKRFEEVMMQTDPRGYQYLLHRQAGGTDEDFFAQKTIDLPDYDTFKESVDLQVRVYTQELRNSGIPEKSIKLLVDTAVKEKDIFTLADAAYKKKEATDAERIRSLNTQLEQDQQQMSRATQNLSKAITDQIASKDMTIIVPEAQRPAFEQFVKQRVRFDQENGTFMFAQTIEPKNLARQLEAMYLQFKNGDLTDMIRREAETSTTRRLRRAVDKSKDTSKDQGATNKRKMTLGEL